MLGSRLGGNDSESGGFKYLVIAQIDRLSSPRDAKQTATRGTGLSGGSRVDGNIIWVGLPANGKSSAFHQGTNTPTLPIARSGDTSISSVV